MSRTTTFALPLLALAVSVTACTVAEDGESANSGNSAATEAPSGNADTIRLHTLYSGWIQQRSGASLSDRQRLAFAVFPHQGLADKHRYLAWSFEVETHAWMTAGVVGDLLRNGSGKFGWELVSFALPSGVPGIVDAGVPAYYLVHDGAVDGACLEASAAPAQTCASLLVKGPLVPFQAKDATACDRVDPQGGAGALCVPKDPMAWLSQIELQLEREARFEGEGGPECYAATLGFRPLGEKDGTSFDACFAGAPEGCKDAWTHPQPNVVLRELRPAAAYYGNYLEKADATNDFTFWGESSKKDLEARGKAGFVWSRGATTDEVCRFAAR